MKDVVINDVHVGHRMGSKWHFDSLNRFFTDQLLPDIKKHKYENVWILGDLFESRTHTTFDKIAKAVEIIESLAEAVSGKVYMLVGNHDLRFKNNNDVHNFDAFKNIKGVEILLGKGMLEVNGKSLVYSSYDDSEAIYDYLTTNKIKADVFFGHLETDGYNVIKYINDNLLFGYSGHIHSDGHLKDKCLENKKSNIFALGEGNFYYLPSTQQNTTAEVDTIHGYSVIDWNTCEVDMIDNKVSGKFKTICFGDELHEVDIKNNFIKPIVDHAKVRKLSTRKLLQDTIVMNFIEGIEKYSPAIVFDTDNIDSENEKSMREILSDVDKVAKESELVDNTNSIEDDILLIVKESELEYAEETYLYAKKFMDNREK